MKNAITVAIVTVAIVALSSCSARPVYSHYESVSILGWNMDSILNYTLVADSACAYSLSVHVRNTDIYPYENLWLFMTRGEHKDTVEIFLSDERGNRLGNEHNGYYDACLMLREPICFDADTSLISIQHGMRDTDLVGLTAIGLELHKIKTTENGQE